VFIATQLSSGHSAFDKRARGALIAEKGAAGKWLVSRLIRHLLLTTDDGGKTKHQQNTQFSIRP
jgi:hypothetical protein